MQPLDEAVSSVLAQYPSARRRQVTALGNHGGFSGARLWRVGSEALGSLALRAWPHSAEAARLVAIHRLQQAAASRLSFIPTLIPSASGESIVHQAGRCWELATWMPGRADFHAAPTSSRLTAGCAALAQLHDCWEETRPVTVAPCPAVRRRLALLEVWEKQGEPPPLQSGLPPATAELVQHAHRLVSASVNRVRSVLASWIDRPVAMQPCLCDVWHDHLLFEGDRLTGLVDFGAVKPDHVAVDLARLLGSLVGDDRNRWEEGLGAYRSVRPLAVWEQQLALVLDWTGTVAGIANWVSRLQTEERSQYNLVQATARLEGLVGRVTAWTNGSADPLSR
jgi:Ser/Thr protein kinase RdoA (MazF antagonist)